MSITKDTILLILHGSELLARANYTHKNVDRNYGRHDAENDKACRLDLLFFLYDWLQL